MPVSPWKLGLRKLLEKPEVGILSSDWLIWFLQWEFFADMKLTLHKSQVPSYSVMQWWACSSLMSIPCLQRRVAKVASGLFYCWSSLRNNTVATHLQRFTLNYVSRRFVVWLLNAHILAGNAARQWHADRGKPRTFVRCEKKHECVCSNASTSLKNPLLVRVWPMCLGVNLHLCRLLIMQYKITWLVRMRQCKLVELRLNC